MAMASAPPISAGGRTRARVFHYVKLASGAFATALLAAWLTYFFTAQLNTKAAIQQQYLLAVQDFTTTGARVDASITELSDNVLDGTQIYEARREARQAIAAHAASAQGLVQIMGEGNVSEYMKGLATLRLLVDDTDSKPEVLRTSQARFDLMSNRTVMVAEARRRIFQNS